MSLIYRDSQWQQLPATANCIYGGRRGLDITVDGAPCRVYVAQDHSCLYYVPTSTIECTLLFDGDNATSTLVCDGRKAILLIDASKRVTLQGI